MEMDRLGNYAKYIANTAISRLKSIDRDLREVGWNIDDGSTREKIKMTIRELNHMLESVDRFIQKEEDVPNKGM